jgi:Tfp pilus assembly protein PilE
LTLVELLVCIGIIAILIALMIPAVQRVRAAASYAQGQYQLRQIGLAIHQYAQMHGQKLPRNAHYWEKPYLTLPATSSDIRDYRIFWHTTVHASILPFLEEQAVYQSIMVNGEMPGRLPAGMVLTVFQNPLDPTGAYPPGGPDTTCSYVANAQVFSMPRSIVAGVPDGLSNTIFFAEHYRNCRVWFDVFTTYTGDRASSRGQHTAPTFADCGYTWQTGSGRGFDLYPITAGNPPRSTSLKNATFQLAPAPAKCDPRLPNAASSRGLQVLMGDGSVRTIHQDITPHVFWGAVTPDRGEADLPDF